MTGNALLDMKRKVRPPQQQVLQLITIQLDEAGDHQPSKPRVLGLLSDGQVMTVALIRDRIVASTAEGHIRRFSTLIIVASTASTPYQGGLKRLDEAALKSHNDEAHGEVARRLPGGMVSHLISSARIKLRLEVTREMHSMDYGGLAGILQDMSRHFRHVQVQEVHIERCFPLDSEWCRLLWAPARIISHAFQRSRRAPSRGSYCIISHGEWTPWSWRNARATPDLLLCQRYITSTLRPYKFEFFEELMKPSLIRGARRSLLMSPKSSMT